MTKSEMLAHIEVINKQATGTYSGAIIKLTRLLTNLIEELAVTKEGNTADAHLQVPDVQDDLSISIDTEEMPQVVVPVSKNKTARKASKATTNRAKKTT